MQQAEKAGPLLAALLLPIGPAGDTISGPHRAGWERRRRRDRRGDPWGVEIALPEQMSPCLLSVLVAAEVHRPS